MKKPKWMTKSSRKKGLLLELLRQYKLLFTTIGMAACIGLVLGLVSLYMTKQETPEAYNETTFAEKEEPTSSKDQTDASNQSLEGFSFFVIQGGVFSNMENANSQAEKFTEYGHAPFNWQTEDGVYVFVDVASNEEEAKHLAKKIEQNSLDVFVTKREIDSVQLSMSDSEYEWLTQFLTLWQDSVKQSAKGEKIKQEEWDKLMEAQIADESELDVIQHLQSLQQETKQMNEGTLLEMVHLYEKNS